MARTLKKDEMQKKKRATRGMGSIREKNGGYEGRITIKVNGKSKQNRKDENGRASKQRAHL